MSAKLLSPAKILWVKGRWTSHEDFVQALEKKGMEIDVVSNGKNAVAQVVEKIYDVIIVDAASMRTNGKRICKSLRETVELPLILIVDESPNNNPNASVILELPFTSRKLTNRILPFIPGESKHTVKVGEIVLDVDRKQIVKNDKREVITPRLCHLLRILMERQGVVVERNELFKKVWHTDYTGDTRTLDVHISWLRQIIEDNPRKPKHLVTIRGVGYRFDE